MASKTQVNCLAEAYFFLAASAVNIEKVVNCFKIDDRKEFSRILEALQK